MAEFLFGASLPLVLLVDLVHDAAVPFRAAWARVSRCIRNRRIDALVPREIAR